MMSSTLIPGKVRPTTAARCAKEYSPSKVAREAEAVSGAPRG
jgi:hypothetical protein